MSLILEALKKSELERQRRQAPGLLTPAAAGARRRRSPGWPVIVLALLVLGVLAAWWLGYADVFERRPAPSTDAPPGEIAASPAMPAEPVTSADDEADEPVDLPARPQPEPTGAPRPDAAREAPAMVAPAAPDPLADPDIDDATRARLADALGTLPEPPSREEQGAPPSREDLGAPPRTDRPGQRIPPLATPGADDGNPPLMHELPFTVRRDLPEIRVSMIVFSGDAESRFALINGERRIEGDEVSPELRLIGIAGQELLFEFRGTRFRLRQGAG